MSGQNPGPVSDADFQLTCLSAMYETIRDRPTAFNVVPVIIHELPERKYGFQCAGCDVVIELTEPNFLIHCNACDAWHLVTTDQAPAVPAKKGRRKK